MTEREIFAAAFGRTDPADRQHFLDAACGRDTPLRQRIEHLIRLADGAGSFLERPDDTAAYSPETVTLLPPTAEFGGLLAGRYKLLEAIGEGGMGTVWMAEQTTPVQRRVAVKLIKAGMDSKQVLARFEAERQALALMDHPNIARVFDGGVTDDGQSFFVMELVKGVPVTTYCDERRLTLRERLALFADVCRAVQHAHQKGVIHRDLKPSNVLVAPYDGRPVVKVIDFGVAKATGQKLTADTLFTGFGAVVGTPQYMSPEQAELNNADIDTRSDVYSLGVLLYELLTGSTPLTRDRVREIALVEVLRVVREEEPPRPSTRLSTTDQLPSIAANRGIEPRQLSGLVRGELDWIVMKALEKDRDGRYETANALAADVGRYLADEPVLACPPSAGYRLRKFARRNRGWLIAGSLVTLALVLGTVGTAIGFVEAAAAWRAEYDQRLVAERKERDAETQKTLAIAYRDKAIETLRATTGEDVERLIGERTELSPNERAYLEAIAGRWQQFAGQVGDDEQSRAIRSEGHQGTARLWYRLGRLREARDEFAKARELRTALVAEFPNEPSYLLELSRTRHNLALILADQGSHDEALSEYASAIGLQQRLLDGFPLRPEYLIRKAISHNNLGILLNARGRHEEAGTELRAAHDLLTQLLAQVPDSQDGLKQLANVRTNTGNVYADLGERERARTEYETARDTLARLAKVSPDVTEYQVLLARSDNNLAILFVDLGKGPEAKQHFQQAHDALTRIAEQYPSVVRYQFELAAAHTNMANVHADEGDADKARAAIARAQAIYQKLTDQHPEVPEHRRELARTYKQAGSIALQLGEFEQAVQSHQKARDVFEQLTREQPKSAVDEQHLASTDHSLGMVYAGMKKHREAREAYGRAVQGWQQLTKNHPAVPDYHLALARSHNSLGVLLSDDKEPEAARAEYDKAIAIQEGLVKDHPKSVAYRLELGGSYVNTAIIVRSSGDPDAALKRLERAIELLRPLHEASPGNVNMLTFLRNAHINRAMTYEAMDRFEDAAGDWEVLTRLSPKDPEAYVARGRAQQRAGKWKEAIASFGQALAIDGTSAPAKNDLAFLLATCPDPQLRDPDRAIDLAKQVTKEYPDDGDTWRTLGVARYAKGEWKAAFVALEKGCRLNEGGTADDYFYLAMAYQRAGDQEQARAALGKGLKEYSALKKVPARTTSLKKEAEDLVGKPK